MLPVESTQSEASEAYQAPKQTKKSAIARDFHDLCHDKDQYMATIDGRMDELHAYHHKKPFWRIYRTFCQFRFGYLAFLVLMVIVMTSFSYLMEIFFAIFLPSAQFDPYYLVRAIVLLLCLPVILFFLSYFFEETLRFFLDAINKVEGSLPNFRLAVAVVINYLRHRHALQEIQIIETTTNPSQENTSQRRHSRPASLLLAAEDDPFVDEEDQEEEDQETQEDQPNDDLSTQDPAELLPKDPRSRWRRANAAIKAALLLNKIQYEGPEIECSTYVIVDFLCPVLFEIVTLSMFLVKLVRTWSLYAAFLTYVRSGVCVVAMYLLLWMITHFWSSRNQQMRIMVSTYRRKRRVLFRAVNELERIKKSEHLWLTDVGFRFYHHVGRKMNPVPTCKRPQPPPQEASNRDIEAPAEAPINDIEVPTEPSAQRSFADRVAHRLAHVQKAHDDLQSKNPWHQWSHNHRMGFMVLAVILTSLISLGSFFLGWPLMGLCMIRLSGLIQTRFPQIFGRAFRHFVTAFVLLSLVFFSSTWVIGTFVKGGEFKLGPYNATQAPGVHEHKLSRFPSLQKDDYPICTVEYDGLSVLDLALIADAAYGATQEIKTAALVNRLNGTDLSDYRHVNWSNQSTDHQSWMELYFPTQNLTVVAVRGTASATDALEDLHYWFGISIMQAVNVFVPFLRQLPEEFVVAMLSMRAIEAVMPAPVYVPLLRHVESVKRRVGASHLVLTGHSLGGAMAAMVGAKTQIRAVSFSGPGLVYSRGRFGIASHDIRDHVLTIKPELDIVPQVDQLGGVVVEIECKHASPMKCHSTHTHMCELYASCGDPRGRNWSENQECNEYNRLPSRIEKEL